MFFRHGKLPRSRHDELVVAALLPQPRLLAPRRLKRAVARCMAWLGLPAELSRFDPLPLLVARTENCAVFEGGPGSGKTHGWVVPTTMLRDGPLLAFDPQKNARERDLPLRRALGRLPLLMDPEDLEHSASINVLAGLAPDRGGFASDIGEIALCLIEDLTTGEHADLRKRGRALLELVLANQVYEAWQHNEEPLLTRVRAELISGDITTRLELWASEGHPSYLGVAREMLADHAHDPELIRSVQFFVSDGTRWLDDWPMAALVVGGTARVLDPLELVGDRGRIDVFLQPRVSEMKVRAGAWRLILHSFIRPHIRRTEAECHGLPKTMLLIDETPALGRFDMLQEVIYRHRQKGLIAVLLYQSRQQIDQLYGAGAASAWEAAADVRGYARVSEADYAAEIERQLGETLVLVPDRQSAPGGGLAGYAKRWEIRPVAPSTRLMNMPKGECVVVVAHDGGRTAFFGRMPFWFEHPLLAARMRRAMVTESERVAVEVTTDAEAGERQGVMSTVPVE